MPQESEDPVIDLQQGQQIAAMYVSFASERLDNNQITDYLTRVIQPKLVTVPGVQRAEILGAGSFLGLSIPVLSENPMLIFILPPGGFFVFGILMAVVNRLAEKRGKPRAELRGCEACPMAASCTLTAHETCGKTDAKEAQN